MFKALRIEAWRQYRSVDIEFHPQLTILTGANGAGKTTILNILGNTFGWGAMFVSTPRYGERRGVLEYVTDFWRGLLSSASPAAENYVGELRYSDGGISQLVIPRAVNTTYALELRPGRPIRGLHIPSHRPTYTYQQVTNIPTVPKTRDQVFAQYWQYARSRYLGQHVSQTPNYLIKETLISLATFGIGNDVVTPNPQLRALFDEFQAVLRAVLPPKIGFRSLSIRIPEVVLDTASGEISLDAVSGGIASIIDIAWQIFMYAPSTEPFVVTLDEPENHLHPELQRSILSSLMAAFPQVQFVVATHKPFIVSSVPESHVYVLDYDEDRKVYSKLLDLVNKAGTANDILRGVLGLDATLPLWVELRLADTLRKYEGAALTSEMLGQLRSDLTSMGMERLVPDAIADIVEGMDRQ